MPSPTAKVEKPTPPGTDAAALTELRNAAATYDYLRGKDDPAQFWEMLRLARSRRALDGSAGLEAAPSPAAEESVRQELDSIRRNYSTMVGNLRRYLKPISGLPEPAERFEMALAFLLASSREHQAVAKWLAEPGKHEAKAAEKLRSLANITDPYREALKPWTLKVGAIAVEEPALPEVVFSEVAEPEPPPAPKAAALDPNLLEGLRRAVQCREIFSGLYLEAELWEAMVLATGEPDRTRAALDVLAQDAESELLEELQVDAEALFEKVTQVRSKYSAWVAALREAFSRKPETQGDPGAFEVALGLAMSAPSTRSQVCLWLDDPSRHQKESADLLQQWWGQAAGYLKAAGAA
jgi:hypothetical protein